MKMNEQQQSFYTVHAEFNTLSGAVQKLLYTLRKNKPCEHNFFQFSVSGERGLSRCLWVDHTGVGKNLSTGQ
jgi:hypothetical protein